MAILLEVDPSENQLISGIPEYLSLSSNTPSIFLYTFDGSTPDIESSLVAIDKIYMPSSDGYITVNIVAYSEGETSEMIILEFATSLDIASSRLLIDEGIAVLSHDSIPTTSLSTDYQGNEVRSTDKDLNDLDIKTSEYDSLGIPNPERTTYDFIKFPVSISFKRDPEVDSLDNVYFNPKASLIRIDGSTREAYDAQVVRFVNRSYGSIEAGKNSQYENPLKKSNLITGNLVRYAYNPSTGIIVFYYFDSKSSRWIISKQKTDKKTFDFSGNPGRSRLGKYVFRWNKDPVFTKLI